MSHSSGVPTLEENEGRGCVERGHKDDHLRRT